MVSLCSPGCSVPLKLLVEEPAEENTVNRSDTFVYNAFLLSNTSPGLSEHTKTKCLVHQWTREAAFKCQLPLSDLVQTTYKWEQQTGYTQIQLDRGLNLHSLYITHHSVYHGKKASDSLNVLLSGKRSHFHLVRSKPFVVQERGNKA